MELSARSKPGNPAHPRSVRVRVLAWSVWVTATIGVFGSWALITVFLHQETTLRVKNWNPPGS